jgi:hypothetical protein
MKNESEQSCFAQRGTNRHQTTAEHGVVLLHAKDGVHQEAPVGKIAELVGLGGHSTTAKTLVNARNASREEVGEMNGNDPKKLTNRDCGADVRD